MKNYKGQPFFLYALRVWLLHVISLNILPILPLSLLHEILMVVNMPESNSHVMTISRRGGQRYLRCATKLSFPTYDITHVSIVT